MHDIDHHHKQEQEWEQRDRERGHIIWDLPHKKELYECDL